LTSVCRFTVALVKCSEYELTLKLTHGLADSVSELTLFSGHPPSPVLAVPNVTPHLSTANVPIIVLFCNGPFLLSFMFRV